MYESSDSSRHKNFNTGILPHDPIKRHIMLHKKYILEYIGYINGTLMNSQKSCEFIKIPLKKSVGGSFVIHFMLIVLAKLLSWLSKNWIRKTCTSLTPHLINDFCRKKYPPRAQARQKILCKSRQAAVKKTGANQGLARAGHSLA